MPGYDRPEGGWNYDFEGMNTIDAPDAIDPKQYPYARNIRINGRHIRTRPGYIVFATNVIITTTCPITSGNEGVAYTFTFTATGGSTPYVWTLISGAFPGGLSLATSGVLSGTPTTNGYFTFTVQVTDNRGSTDTLSCSMFIVRECAGNDWSGCMSGSFSAAADWTYFSGNSSNTGINANGTAYVTSAGGMRKTANTCGAAQDQEVYMVYSSKTSGVGNRGWVLAGPGCRLTGTVIGNSGGYFFLAQFWAGTLHNAACGDENFITLSISRVVLGVGTVLQSTTIAGPDLTTELPMIIRAVQESGQARITGTLGSTQVLNVLDPSPLGAGGMGFGCPSSCGGVSPTVFFDYIKGRNL